MARAGAALGVHGFLRAENRSRKRQEWRRQIVGISCARMLGWRARMKKQPQRRTGLASLMTRAAWSLRIKLVFTGLILLGIGFGAGWIFRWVKEPALYGSGSI